MSHANARLTPHGRLRIVQRHRIGATQAHIAAAMGISRKYVKKWIDRFAEEGTSGPADRASRPHPTHDSARGLAGRARFAPNTGKDLTY